MQNNIFSGLFVGQNFFTLQEVDSTNNFLKELLSNSTPLIEGTVIMAENQYAGRGQQQKSWHTEPGKNLTFSLLLKPAFLPVASQFDLTRAVSIGVFDALEPLLGDNLKIKWPNDIYYNDKKLGGILIENIIQAGKIKNSVIGIGLNVNQGSFPAYLPDAVSLKQILQQDYDLKVLLSDICRYIETRYLDLKGGNVPFLRMAYLDRLYRINENKVFKSANGTFNGFIRTVRDNGLLVVQNNNGEYLEFNFKEIAFLNDDVHPDSYREFTG